MSSTKLSANDSARKLIAERLATLRERIARACDRVGRDPAEISLLAVSKTQPPGAVCAAHALGLRRFGENYLQEALDKMAAVPSDCEWHFIGAIQSNKTRPIAEHFAWAHCLDRAKIARRLNAQRPAVLPPLKVCLQVNVSDERSKSGLNPGELPALIEEVAVLPRLSLQGLMCIPRPSPLESEQRAAFRQLRELRDRHLPRAAVLSMGMSADLDAAIAEGSTMLRVGTALFGPRHTTPPENG